MQSGVLFELESNLAQSAEVDSRESDSSTATNAPALTPIVLHQELPDIDSDPDSSTYLGDDFSFIRQLPLDVLPASAESSRVELPYSIQDLYAENVSLSADLTAARESIARLELENDRLRADLEEDKRSSTEIIEKLRSQLNDMEASMSTVRAMHGSKVESMRLQIQELEDQAKTRTATIGQLSTDGAILRQEVERMQSKEKHLVQERDASLNREASALKRLSVAGQRLDSAERDVRLASASQLLSWQQCNRLLTLVVLAMPLKQQGNDSQEQIGTPKELAVIIRSVMEGLSRGGKLEDISSVWGALRRRMTQGDVANSVRSPLFIISTVHQLLDSESEPLGADSQLRHTLSQIKDDLFAIAQEQMARGLKLRIMNVSAPLAREQLPITLEELLRNIRQSWTSADLEREGCILLEAAFGAIGEAGLEVIERASNSAQTSSQEQNYRTLLRALASKSPTCKSSLTGPSIHSCAAGQGASVLQVVG
ncbi:hypothetical protein BCR39DRAFT_551926 [Naematelia encephala]|uniref:Uncharacterized protein n=1 Tax=Naematelia encephala TaxID=71784 RepID=A0A1Y2AIE8_9TREE|nr:hypothetical protein BCR39DRAFT_551926 [Naematelia encephala]